MPTKLFHFSFTMNRFEVISICIVAFISSLNGKPTTKPDDCEYNFWWNQIHQQIFQKHRWIVCFSSFTNSFSVPLTDDGVFEAYFEGDILFDEETNDKAIFQWPHATVIYEISEQFSRQEKRAIRRAMTILSKVSCIKFRRRTYEHAYVKFGVSLFYEEFSQFKIIV